MLRICPSDPASTNDDSPTADVGGLYCWGNDILMYVKNGSADTNAVATKLACFMTAGTRGVCTMKAAEVTSGTLGTVTKPAGVWAYAVSFGNYGYIRVVSSYCDVFTDTGVVDGDFLVCDGGATETFIADTAIAGEEHGVFGRALADDVSTNVKAAINCL